MNYTIETIADFCEGEAHICLPGSAVSRVIIDHRDLDKQGALFVALKGARFDGHRFIPELIDQGVVNFLISDESIPKAYSDRANFVLVENAVEALQSIAAAHRSEFEIETIAITGSNGKTIVKEWLNALLEDRYRICRSPKSYNSQIGVPLSVLQLDRTYNLSLFEAGISRPDEMRKLEKLLKPTIGIFTNLGDAHAAHFESQKQKFEDKWQLFEQSKNIVCCEDQHWFSWLSEGQKARCFTWSFEDKNANVFVESKKIQSRRTVISISHQEESHSFIIPFTDKASVENALHCVSAALLLGQASSAFFEKLSDLSPVAMRMEVKQGVENSLLIDDSYNSDLGSLQAALEHLSTQVDREKWVILSDFSENTQPAELYQRIGELLRDASVNTLIGIGPEIQQYRSYFEPIATHCFPDVSAFWNQLDKKLLRQKAILIKGSRKYKLEEIARKLQAQHHETVLEIDLQKLAENLAYFKSKVGDQTKIMVMVKAFAYGSGGVEVASFLESHHVDYLGVAYADEGVALRKAGIKTPIMVMSPEQNAYEIMLQHNIEPEIFSINSLNGFIQASKSFRHLFQTFPIHLKLNTGMNRLGFDKEDLPELVSILKAALFIKVQTAFTHLSASDSKEADRFTHNQIAQFQQMASIVSDGLGYKITRHCLNSTGVVRFPEHHFEMVRLGIGLYGFTGSEHNKFVHALGTLKSYIVQIRTVGKDQVVGYGLKGKADHERRIATVAVGYADGLDRRLSGGQWSLKWQDVSCPIVGNICMDMCMIDVTDTFAQEGDEIIVFEGGKEVEMMAEKLGTIPYEILTKVSERVRRVFLQE
jgi:alanine racemase